MSQDGKRDEYRSAPVDARLRRSLDADPETLRDVIRAAVVKLPDSGARTGPGWKFWAAAAAAVAVVVLASTVWRSVRPNHEDPRVPLITNASGELRLVLPDEPEGTAGVGSSRIDEPPIIFNNSQVIAASVPGIEPRFVVSGGGS